MGIPHVNNLNIWYELGSRCKGRRRRMTYRYVTPQIGVRCLHLNDLDGRAGTDERLTVASSSANLLLSNGFAKCSSKPAPRALSLSCGWP